MPFTEAIATNMTKEYMTDDQRFASRRPDVVVYQAGADPYEHDVLGGLAITREGLRQRDRLVLEACARRGIPCAITFGGGYAQRMADTVTIHANTCLAAIDVSREISRATGGS